MVKHILFDFDGTLVDSRALLVKLYNEMAAQHQFRMIRDQDLALLRSLSISERVTRLGVPVLQIPKLVIAGKQLYQDHIRTLHVVPGMKDVVAKLSAQGIRSSILSSNSESNIRTLLKSNRMESSFKEIISAKHLFGKHHSIRKVMKQWGTSPSRMIYVGDELRDIEACQKLGVPIVAVTWGYDSPRLLLSGKPDYVVNSPGELLKTLLTLV
ncbi:phosphoglycolate phosphatase [Paenibacillus marchantiophytorum]|uniref:Phosphoglycolate phosphatase n=1 Tax=Paenibacillus marchantiophytorum TaxID=1619310 RepID=A0ABQ1EM33_9BACL|nr:MULTISPECIES: HAD-IA family hydrolase [Paenibacillus]UKS26815.1 HAD-IA family hydrolase [Paenibacillus sp. HWE-109]GFZ78163.1 phosphoglycolate phosphatase [Paenibacillus marchantiophytorum]